MSSVINKKTLNAVLADIGGTVAADAHKDSTAKTMRSVIRQYALGEGRPKTEGWVPPYLLFPAGHYFEAPATDAGDDSEADDLADAA